MFVEGRSSAWEQPSRLMSSGRIIHLPHRGRTAPGGRRRLSCGLRTFCSAVISKVTTGETPDEFIPCYVRAPGSRRQPSLCPELGAACPRPGHWRFRTAVLYRTDFVPMRDDLQKAAPRLPSRTFPQTLGFPRFVLIPRRFVPLWGADHESGSCPGGCLKYGKRPA